MIVVQELAVTNERGVKSTIVSIVSGGEKHFCVHTVDLSIPREDYGDYETLVFPVHELRQDSEKETGTVEKRGDEVTDKSLYARNRTHEDAVVNHEGIVEKVCAMLEDGEEPIPVSPIIIEGPLI